MSVGEVRPQGEVIGYADGEPICADRAADDQEREIRDNVRSLRRSEGRRDKEGYIYFLQGEHGGPIKIGFSVQPTFRLETLQSASPYRMVIRRKVAGTARDERRLHERFKSARTHGEWFEPTEELAMLANARVDTEEPQPFVRPRRKNYGPPTPTAAMREVSERVRYAEVLKEQRKYWRDKQRHASGVSRHTPRAA